MILDERAEFADATSVVYNAGTTTVIGDVMDLGASPTLQDIGNGQPVYLVVTTDTEIITGGGTGSLTIELVSDSVATLDNSATVHIVSPTLVTDDASNNSAALNAGGVIICQALPISATYERYLGILSKPVTENITAGKINAFLTLNPSNWIAYPDGI